MDAWGAAPERRKRPGVDPLKRISVEAAADLAARAFRNAGVGGRDASSAAEILALAEAMGIRTHGLNRVRDYVTRINAGGIDPAAEILALRPAPALRHIDGKDGLGPAVARRALDEAIGAAREAGIGATFVRRASHLGALAPYLYIAARAGFAAVVTTNTAPMIAPAGGRSPVVGNNPLGLVVPHPGGQHVLVDMALSVAARSRVRAAASQGAP
ncbi:MAG: Ldh family oxidoreductase, partial [Sphingomonadaceae bacterium]